jgi:hypothetical protein
MCVESYETGNNRRKMHGEKLHKFYSSTTTVMAIKSGKMGGTCSMIGSYEKVIQNLFGPRGGQYESGPQRNFVRGLDSYGSGEGPVRVGATGGGGGATKKRITEKFCTWIRFIWLGGGSSEGFWQFNSARFKLK